MRRFIFCLLCAIFPVLAFSDTPISFAPPLTDYSVGFLANIFGVVDGVLHGTGSQIMGAIFEVFNAAVMALGGMIITYTMLISTMNTAHEGEMLGKKWNSIWVPVRATAGFALLIPKASGYCLLQIFVMWVVVQGVGAADKVWDAALNYLNRGGVIIQAQQNPTQALFSDKSSDVTAGAMTILSGQVCMLAVQKILETKLSEYKAEGSTVCATHKMPASGSGGSHLANFCSQNTVPNFADTVDINGAVRSTIDNYISKLSSVVSGSATLTGNVAYNTAQKSETIEMPTIDPPSVLMPSFDASSPFYEFNGICGHISWTWMDQTQIKALLQSGLTVSDLKTALLSRSVGIAQMYSDLLTTAQTIVNNDTLIAKSSSTPAVPATPSGLPSGKLEENIANTQTAPKTAVESLGIPLTAAGTPCKTRGTSCIGWGPGIGSSGGALLSGTELQMAVMDYTAVMKPTLTLLSQAVSNQNTQAAKAFIQTAKGSGWLMAGSYFFNLVQLNNQNLTPGGMSDSNSGLGASAFNLNTISNGFPTAGSSPECSGESTKNPWSTKTPPTFPIWCQIMQGDSSQVMAIFNLFTGAALTPVSSPSPASPPTGILKTTPLPLSTLPENSVFGYVQNSLLVELPGQAGQNQLTFDQSMIVNFESQSFSLPPANFACGGISFIFFHICIGEILGNIIYNAIIVNIMNYVAGFLLNLIQQVMMSIVTIPLQGFAAIFKGAVNILSVPGINPIVALANMGTYYINFVGNLWLILLVPQMIASTLTFFGPLLAPLFMMAMPIVVAWSAIMVGVGFITAYYVPIIPYMIFTFGTIAWFIAVIEAMVAAPIVALGIVHPEGHDAFGKGEAAIMILMNVFLRPAMMIIGYISAISLSYVGVWILNAGFDNAIGFMQGSRTFGTYDHSSSQLGSDVSNLAAQSGIAVKNTVLSSGNALADEAGDYFTGGNGNAQARGEFDGDYNSTRQSADTTWGQMKKDAKWSIYSPSLPYSRDITTPGAGDIQGGYVGWAGIFAYFFSILIYTTIYMQIVEQAFTLISVLPDKVLRWIGGQAESAGSEAARVAEKVQGKVEKAGGESDKAMMQAGKSGAAILGKKSTEDDGAKVSSKGDVVGGG